MILQFMEMELPEKQQTIKPKQLSSLSSLSSLSIFILVNCHPYPSVESFICHLNLFLLIILALLLYLYRRFILLAVVERFLHLWQTSGVGLSKLSQRNVLCHISWQQLLDICGQSAGSTLTTFVAPSSPKDLYV